MLAVGVVLLVLIVLYVVLATVLATSWKMDADGLTLRSAATVGIRMRIAWTTVASIACGTERVYRTSLESMNLDARITRQRHVTLVRNDGKRAVQFTPRHIVDFERQLQVVLGSRSDWSLHEARWHHVVSPSR